MAAKISVNGESFVFNRDHKPLSEALAIEKGLGCTYGQWEDDLAKGSARALAALVWLVWKRDGRDVALEDILSGDVPVNLASLEVEGDDPEPDPTIPPAAKGASPGTGRSTSSRSHR